MSIIVLATYSCLPCPLTFIIKVGDFLHCTLKAWSELLVLTLVPKVPASDPPSVWCTTNAASWFSTDRNTVNITTSLFDFNAASRKPRTFNCFRLLRRVYNNASSTYTSHRDKLERCITAVTNTTYIHMTCPPETQQYSSWMIPDETS